MLRLGTFDLSGGDYSPPAVPPALIARALGDLISERMTPGGPGYAVENLCAALIDDAPRAGQICIDKLIACGVGVEAIYDTYIPRAAARLGEMWVDDDISFTAVTLGMARLTEAFRRLSPIFLRERPAAPRTGRAHRHALFALAPGETHALGVVMAADYFHRAGWSVRVELKADAARLTQIVRAQPFDIIGISAGSRRMIPDLRRLVERLRAAARPATRLILGGPLVALDGAAAGQIGVDMAVCAAPDALCELEKSA